VAFRFGEKHLFSGVRNLNANHKNIFFVAHIQTKIRVRKNADFCLYYSFFMRRFADE